MLDHNEPWTADEALEPTKISDIGIALIKEFEGYHKAQPDGSCVAYLCPAGVPTIGWGATEGVTLGMRWTADEAEAALHRELAQFERAVVKLVTVPINQHQFDALVSFAYNCGSGNLQRSTLLRRLNAGQYDLAERQFMVWTKARNPKTGQLRELRGLVRRRKREAELFGRAVVPDAMPQRVERPAPVQEAVRKSWTIKGALISVIGGVAAFFEQSVQVLMKSADEVAGWGPVTGLMTQIGANAKTIGVALGVAGIAIVVARRLNAADKRKIG